MEFLQIPDVRTGDDIIDAVVVDEEAVGSEGRGCGAKILYGRGALNIYFSQQKLKDIEVSPYIAKINLLNQFYMQTTIHQLILPKA